MNRFTLGPTSKTAIGKPMGLGCERCPILKLCGGTTEFDCYANCCGAPESCTLACPRADNWVRVVWDAGGMKMRRAYAIRHGSDNFPRYIPHVHHGYSRSGFLSSKWVALTTFDVTAPDSDRRFNGPSDLRRYFRLSPDSELLLLSIGKDNRLEHHWRYSGSRRLAKYLACLGVSHITAPNFSFPLDVPRPEHLVNRSRSLCEAERFSAEGLSVIPHVNAFNQRDWDCWRSFFRDHRHLSIVAQEFQTGLASRSKASWHIWQLMNLEQALGRGFRLIAVGGRRHLPLLVGLSAVTITDANPFQKAHARQKLLNGRWVKAPTEKGLPVDDLLEANVTNYTNLVESLHKAAKQNGPILPTSQHGILIEPVSVPSVVSESQLAFWPLTQNSSEEIQQQPPNAGLS